jgi:hypothetical protein
MSLIDRFMVAGVLLVATVTGCASRQDPPMVEFVFHPSDKPQEDARTTQTALQTQTNQHQQASARHVGSFNVSPDVQGTPLGDYLVNMADVVRSRWYQLVENETSSASGKVVVHFRLNDTGKISNMLIVQNGANERLQDYCTRALLEPTFPEWPHDLKAFWHNDHYDTTLTFYYEP